MLTFLLIALAICFIVGPALLLLPSPRQKQQMAMRETARSIGLQVELATIDDPDPDPEKYRSLTGKPLPQVVRCVALRRPRKKQESWREKPSPSWKAGRTSGAPASDLSAGWKWIDSDPGTLSRELRSVLHQALPGLPADVLVVEERRQELSVYWNERSGQQGVQIIAEVMDRLLAAPLTEPEDDDVVE